MAGVAFTIPLPLTLDSTIPLSITPTFAQKVLITP